jgi:hypothetical protein
MPAEKFYAIKYAVEGSGTFPIDMLRYDRSCPMTESATHIIEREGTMRCVELIRFSPAGKSGPNVPRWASFGWKVTKVEYHDGKVEWPNPPTVKP